MTVVLEFDHTVMAVTGSYNEIADKLGLEDGNFDSKRKLMDSIKRNYPDVPVHAMIRISDSKWADKITKFC